MRLACRPGWLRACLALMAALLLAGPARAMPPPEVRIWWMQAMPDGDLFVRTAGGGLFYSDNAGREWVWLTEMYHPYPLDGTDRFELVEYYSYNDKDHLGHAFSLAHSWPTSAMRNAPVRSAGNTHLACHGNRIIERRGHASTWTGIGALPDVRECEQLLADGNTLLVASGDTILRSDRAGRAWLRLPVSKYMRGRTFDFLYALPGQGVFANISGGAPPVRNVFARSADGGLHWTVIDFPRWAPYAKLAGGAYGALYAVTRNLLIVSSDGGSTWRADNPRLWQQKSLCTGDGDGADSIISVQEGPEGMLYVATRSAIYQRPRTGDQWRMLPLEGLRLHVKPHCRIDQLL